MPDYIQWDVSARMWQLPGIFHRVADKLSALPLPFVFLVFPLALCIRFPRAAGTKQHKRSGFKQQKFILLLLQRPEVLSAWPCCLGGSRRESFSQPLVLRAICDIPWLRDPSFQHLPLSPHDVLPCVSLSLCPSSFFFFTMTLVILDQDPP